MNTVNEKPVTTTELIKVEAFKSVIEIAPDQLSKNQISVTKAEEFGHKLLDRALQGMNDDLDIELNDYQVKLKKTYDLMNDRRTPITKLFDDVKKAFTSLEARIDPKSKENIYFKIQQERNKWAEKKAREAQERQRENERKLAIEKERIEVQTQIESQLQMYFNNHLASVKQSMNNGFEAITLETSQDFLKKIQDYEPTYLFKHFEAFKPNVFTAYLSPEEVNNVLTNTKTGKFDGFSNEFKGQLNELKNSIIDKIPAKCKELQSIANAANEAEKSRLEKEAEERRIQEEERLKKEAAEKNQKAISEAETSKQVLTANTLFDMQVGSVDTQAQVREGYEIEVLHPSGYQLICAFYFEREGLKEPIDKLEKKTLGSMKKFCEDWAKKNEEKITSPYLKYKETFKAIAKRA